LYGHRAFGSRQADQNLYVNVGGGQRIREVGIELPLAMALYSARLNQPVPGLPGSLGRSAGGPASRRSSSRQHH
jgi:predicted ATP-dependent serine protease